MIRAIAIGFFLAVSSLSVRAGDLVIMEGAIVTHDPAAQTVYIKECDNCKSMKLKVNSSTMVLIGERRYPFTQSTKLSKHSDTGYDTETKVVQYFRPLKVYED
ncbi:MAG: hypothetical protein AAF493_12625 [Pseudomonadota bacterium]